MAFIPLPPKLFRYAPRSKTPRSANTSASLTRRTFLTTTAPVVVLLNMNAAAAQSGPIITEVKVGDGDAFQSGDLLKLHYTLTLGAFQEDGGKIVDSSRTRGKPFSYKYDTGSVIKGWDQGVTGMKVGGRRHLIIPAELGYGVRGVGNVIPPNSTLYFDIELLGVGYK